MIWNIDYAAPLRQQEATLRGAVDLTRVFGLSKLLVGMVIIGIGTSLPELTVAVEADERLVA